VSCVDRILELARDVIAAGPGLGQARATRDFMTALVDRATMPLVIDADGLNAFREHPDRLAGREGRDVIITPHPGEMARLLGMSTDEVQASRLEIARNFAVAHHVYVVLKGHRTLIATPDKKVFINPTGNPGSIWLDRPLSPPPLMPAITRMSPVGFPSVASGIPISMPVVTA